jgi:hypothetical protein
MPPETRGVDAATVRDNTLSGNLIHAIPELEGPTVGRDEEVATVTALIRSGHRCITLTGLPGVGKTRLAAAVVEGLRSSQSWDVRWIEGPAGGHEPPGGHEPAAHGRADAGLVSLEAATESTAGPILVVIDDAGRESGFVSELAVRRAENPPIQVLSTAWRPLGIAGERVVPIAPLIVPDPAENDREVIGMYGDESAVQLLLGYITYVNPRFRLTPANCNTITELCRLVDGIPSLLLLISAELMLLDPTDLLDCMTADLAGTLDEMAPGYVSLIRKLLDGLGPADVELLRHLGELPDAWSIVQAADSFGTSRIAMAARVRKLLEQGLVRPAALDCRTRFQVLGIIRQLNAEPLHRPRGAEKYLAEFSALTGN